MLLSIIDAGGVSWMVRLPDAPAGVALPACAESLELLSERYLGRGAGCALAPQLRELLRFWHEAEVRGLPRH
jgi:hypothetical protein